MPARNYGMVRIKRNIVQCNIATVISFTNSHLIHLSSMEGGELFQRIQDRQDGAFTERGIIRNLCNYYFLSFLTTTTTRMCILQKLQK